MVYLPDNLEDVLAAINKYVKLHVKEIENEWKVSYGEMVLFQTDDKKALNAFLHGLLVAYATLPKHILVALVEERKRLTYEPGFLPQ